MPRRAVRGGDGLRGADGEIRDERDGLEQANEERRRLASLLVAAQEAERRRISEDIHDDTLQVMGAVQLRLEMLLGEVADPGLEAEVRQLAEVVAAATSRLRRLTFDLRPPMLNEHGLAETLRSNLRELADELSISWELEDRLGAEPGDEPRVILFRIAQEALMNVRKHAGARHVRVSLREVDGGILMVIHDDGRGVPGASGAASATVPGHLGLQTMRERAELAGGRFSVSSREGGGTSVEAWVPA
ncbi:MAG TPA: sensor histidine kinase [Actinomycetota bacterium]